MTSYLITAASILGGEPTDILITDGVIAAIGSGLDARRLALLPDHAIVMHPGPMNRGLEIAAEAADGARSTIVEQVANGVSVRMAVLYLLLSGEVEEVSAP